MGLFCGNGFWRHFSRDGAEQRHGAAEGGGFRGFVLRSMQTSGPVLGGKKEQAGKRDVQFVRLGEKGNRPLFLNTMLILARAHLPADAALG